MQCRQCQYENPAHAKFCLECGARLPLQCAACGTELPVGAKFCLECGTALQGLGAGGQGVVEDTSPQPQAPSPRSYTPKHLAEKILTSRSALEGERKQVTVLFADVAGSTALGERLDPEDMHAIMDRCYRLVMDEVHHYEGTINQFTGDGVMALFGAPVALENAPERAVRAALGMQAALGRYREELSRSKGIDFRMRIGINTGPVVVGKIGDDLRMDYTAVGDTTNVAARLQAAAAPGAILIGEQTAKLVGRRFVTRDVGPLALKGKSEPVAACEVVRALPRAPLVAASESGLTPLVGRAAELTTLETIFAHACSGRGQVAFVAGDAGIGKSRLVHEFRSRLADQEVTWLEGRCVSFGREMPFLPLVDVVKAGFEIDEADGEATIIGKIDDGLAALGSDVASVAPHVRSLLAVDPGDAAVAALDGIARRVGIFDALKRLMLATALRRPLAVLIEDLHWIDQASDEYLNYIADALATAPILLLCTHRPGYRHSFGERSYFTRLALQPLSREETATMAAAMLDTTEFPAEMRTLIASKAEGNPFFIEEVTKSLLEIGALQRTADGYALDRPASQIIIPDTIQDVIMARIDRLGEDPKRAIQIASVIGREFALRLLQRAAEFGDGVEQLVGELRALELIYEKSGVPELAYMFKHALTHDVAYESLLVQRRKELHRIIGRATEQLYADRLAEHFETLAHHYYRGEDWPRAFDYLMKAAAKARAAFANTEAVHFYRRALEAAAHLDLEPKQRVAIYRGMGSVHFHLSEFPEAVEAYRQAVALAATDTDRARLKAGLALALAWAHELDPAIAVAEEANGVAEPAGDVGTAAEATYVLALVQSCRGQLDASHSCYEKAIRFAEAAGKRSRAAEMVVLMTTIATWQGDYRAAIATSEAARRTLKEANELHALAQADSQLTCALGGAGEYAQALAVSAEGLALAESIGDKVWRARMWNTRGWILGELGHFDAADEANRRCLELSRQLGSMKMGPELIGNAEANLADAAIWRSDLNGAEPHLASVAAILADRRSEWMVWRYGMHYQLSAAELALARGDPAGARELIASCLATARRTKSRRYIVRATRLLAACHLAGGDLTGAEGLLTVAVRDARSLGNPPQLWHALLAYGRVLHSLGRREEAQQAWREGLEVAESVAAALPDDLRSTFDGSPLRSTLAELSGC